MPDACATDGFGVLAETHIDTMLPCNVIVQEMPGGGVEVAAINPVESTRGVGPTAQAEVAATLRDNLHRAIGAVK
jgi:hypothetical protein